MTVHVHLLEAIATAGLTYDDRNALADRVRARMADAMSALYGVEPPSSRRRRRAARHRPTPSGANRTPQPSPTLSS